MNDPRANLAANVHFRSAPFVGNWKPAGLLPRLICLALVFSLELILIPVLLRREGLSNLVTGWGALILRGAIGFAVLFMIFAWLKHKRALAAVSTELARSAISLPLLSAHLGAITIFGLLSSALYRPASSNLLALVWLATGLSAIAFAGFAFIRPVFWLRMLRDTGFLWIWVVAGVILAGLVEPLWPLAANVTFRLSRAMLTPFVSGMVVDPAKLLIGTQRFLVKISPECSGLQGVGLILAFGILWLTLFRAECRFPHALILLPVGVAIVFTLNAARIAVLVLIGDAGAEQIALRGFHSQGGWIVFSLVALGFSVVGRKVPWLSHPEDAAGPARSTAEFENPTVRWVLPLVVLLAAGMIAAATAGGFEWLYPLRFFTAAVTLGFLWRKYTDLDWRVSWLAPVTGIVVFLVWIGLDSFTSPGREIMPASFAAASPLARNLWLSFRVLAAIVTVPLAEELAFRGYLYRRLISPDFESVSFRRFSWFALLLSAAIFGLLHGDRWFVGAVASVLYTLVLIRRGSISDAVAAHATTNALLAVDVIAFHHWHLW